jgi:hypothetical protein
MAVWPLATPTIITTFGDAVVGDFKKLFQSNHITLSAMATT